MKVVEVNENLCNEAVNFITANYSNEELYYHVPLNKWGIMGLFSKLTDTLLLKFELN